MAPLRFLLVLALFVLLPLSATAATLSMGASATNVSVGSTFTVTFYVNSGGTSINAVAGRIAYPTDTLDVVSVVKGASILTLWAEEPAYSGGLITFDGIVPNPGYSGSGGRTVSATFRAKAAGTARITYLSSSSVLANDGQGTNVLSSTSGTTITIGSAPAPVPTPTPTPTPTPKPAAEPEEAPSELGAVDITSPTHPDQNAWYRSTYITVSWPSEDSVTQVRTGYGTDPEGTPTVQFTNPITTRSFEGDTGVSYFYLQQRDRNGWGPIARYRIQIDDEEPETPTIAFADGSQETLVLASSDDLSGLDRFELEINGKILTVAASDPTLPVSDLPGETGSLAVRAIDKAGNVATAESLVILVNNDAPWYQSLWDNFVRVSPYVVLLVLLAALAYSLRGFLTRAHAHVIERRNRDNARRWF